MTNAEMILISTLQTLRATVEAARNDGPEEGHADGDQVLVSALKLMADAHPSQRVREEIEAILQGWHEIKKWYA